MVECEAKGRSAPDAAPIPEVAYSLVREVIGKLAEQHAGSDITAAASMVAEATGAILEDVVFVPLDGSAFADLN